MNAAERHRGASRPARRHPRPGVLAQPRGAVGDAGVQGIPAPRVPAERLRVARPGRPPRLPEADGRVAGAGRRQRLHAPAGRRARAVRAPARGARPGQAAVLRHGDAVCRRRRRPAGREPRRAARRRSRATPIIRRAAAPPTSSRRRRSSASTIPIARRRITNLGEIRPFSAFVAAVRQRADGAAGEAGRRLPHPDRDGRVADAGGADSTSSWRAYPQAKWVQWEPFGRHNAREGSRLAFGEYVDAQYAIEKADVILSLDADFLCTGAAGPEARARVRVAPAARRRPRRSSTGSTRSRARRPTPVRKADHRLPLRASEIEAFARAVAAQLGVARRGAPAAPRGGAALARAARQGSAGRTRPEPRHRRRRPAAGRACARARDERRARQRRRDGHLHADGRSAADRISAPALQRAGRRDERRHGRVAADPRRQPGLHGAGRSRSSRDAMQKVALRAHSGCYEDETARAVPLAHSGDALPRSVERRARRRRHGHDRPAADRAALRRQVGARSDGRDRPTRRALRLRPGARVLGGAAACSARTARRRLRRAPRRGPARRSPPRPPHSAPAGALRRCSAGQRRRRRRSTPAPARSPFDRAWRRWLHDGLDPGHRVRAEDGDAAAAHSPAATPSPRPATGLEVVFRPDPSVYDGRFANNAWLQELPKSLTKLTWDNAALIAPATAARLDLDQRRRRRAEAGRAARCAFRSGSRPGQAPDTLTLHLGYGRTRAGRAGQRHRLQRQRAAHDRGARHR